MPAKTKAVKQEVEEVEVEPLSVDVEEVLDQISLCNSDVRQCFAKMAAMTIKQQDQKEIVKTYQGFIRKLNTQMKFFKDN